jgi:hypothetical protein
MNKKRLNLQRIMKNPNILKAIKPTKSVGLTRLFGPFGPFLALFVVKTSKIWCIILLFNNPRQTNFIGRKEYEDSTFILSNTLTQTLRFVTHIRFPSYHVTLHHAPHTIHTPHHITSHY